MFKKIMKSFVVAGVAYTSVLGMSFPAPSRDVLPDPIPRTVILRGSLSDPILKPLMNTGALPDPKIRKRLIRRGVLPDPIPRPAR